MKWDYPYFSYDEMRCRGVNCDCGGRGVPQARFMERLVEIRKAYGHPMIVTSGFRCASHNKRIGGVANSPHTIGLAADIQISNPWAFHLFLAALSLGVKRFGVHQAPNLPLLRRYIHIDIATAAEGYPEFSIWSY